MNNYDWLKPRRRRRNLFIVEGNHEKNELMSLLLKIYPEVDIKLEDIVTYTTNIFQKKKLIISSNIFVIQPMLESFILIIRWLNHISTYFRFQI